MKKSPKQNWESNIRRTPIILGLSAALCMPSAFSYANASDPVAGELVQSVQQGRTVTGKIIDDTGEPLIGVSVLVKGTTVGTITDFDGNYSLEVPSGKHILVISYIGYKTQDITVGKSNQLNIKMEADTQALDEVVVVGYGVMKKRDLTGSIASVKAADIVKSPASNAMEALQGQVPGLDIVRNSGKATSGVTINIRGQRSLSDVKDEFGNNVANAPLFIIDGMQGGDFSDIAPADIESIEVLKDASATAIYGSRGANGVILITTKRGKESKFTFSYAGSVSTDNIKDRTTWMSAGDYLTWRRWAYYYSDPNKYPRGDEPTIENDKQIFNAASDPYAWANIERGWSGNTWDGSKVQTTDWADYVTQTGITTEHTISGSGGSEKNHSYVSFGWLKNEGTIKGQDYTRYTAKINNDMKLTEWLTLAASINATYSVQNYDGGTTSGPRSAYAAAMRNLPYAVAYDDEGKRIEYPGADSKIKTVIDEWNYSTDERKVFRALGSFYAQLNFGKIWKPLEGLSYKLNFGPDFRYYRRGMFNSAESTNREGLNYASLTKSTDFSWTLDNLIYYNRTIGKHDFGFTFLQTATKYEYEANNMSGEGIPLESSLWNAFKSLSSLKSWESSLTEKQLLSYMARMNYTYKGRYMLTASVRRDGASQLADGHKWATFPSVALGWRIDQEEFLKEISWISQLKLRLGYGVTGNSAITPYQTKGGISSLYYPFGPNPTQGYIAYENEAGITNTLANQNLGWEKTAQWNIGVDFNFFNGRINGIVDVYTSKTTDLLMAQSIPTLTGYARTYANVGKTKNFGYDLTFNFVPVRTKDFEWNIGVNAAYSRNEIVSLANGKEDDPANGWFIGESTNSIYTYESAGLWKEEDRADMEKFNANGHDFQIGMARPVDQNGDYKIDANNDRTIVGHYDPRWTLGLNTNFTYKGWDLGIQLYGRMGFKYYDSSVWVGGRYNVRDYDYYNENNKNAAHPKPIYDEGGKDAYYNETYLKNGSYLKIRNISLGYTFPNRLLTHTGLSALRMYAQIKNPGYIFSGCKTLDLDTYSNTYNSGFTFGLNLSF